ncbi:intraflagellar transport protein 46 homolog [Scaptodrosophila lebanonensis]|uniref:Intraflagellar transport protein 46 homolog n=1 Tax=Drosophila lebanonensis TaxID=7225 RepID=A0A6J2U7E4_DROLE|nr:intraflagellar transport protein 46 homolog [Scaptodrosophila lebanonensis]
MNYYDEEITITGPDSKHLSSVKVDQLSGQRGQRPARQRNMLQSQSTDDDGLLQDIIDHDDEAEDSEDDEEDDSELHLVMPMSQAPRPQTRPGSSRNAKPASGATAATAPNIDDDEEGLNYSSDEAAAMGAATASLPHQKLPQPQQQKRNSAHRDVQLSLTPDKWEQLTLQPELKELFPYILKYTPQNIETPCHLQPFIPEFVPAVGDVDAFLKVVAPPLLQPQRQKELDEHLKRMGLCLLDEPSGAQSEPSLLNMKLRSVLSGSRGRNARHASSASLVPTARSPKDIDKWIGEVEQVHMTQSMFDAQPRKDIDPLLEDWPRAYGEPDTASAVEQAYRSCLQDQMSLAEYVRLLSERFNIEGTLDTQADYIHNVHTLFALYLAASQAWE